jgi:hypothetical protein
MGTRTQAIKLPGIWSITDGTHSYIHIMFDWIRRKVFGGSPEASDKPLAPSPTNTENSATTTPEDPTLDHHESLESKAHNEAANGEQTFVLSAPKEPDASDPSPKPPSADGNSVERATKPSDSQTALSNAETDDREGGSNEMDSKKKRAAISSPSHSVDAKKPKKSTTTSADASVATNESPDDWEEMYSRLDAFQNAAG